MRSAASTLLVLPGEGEAVRGPVGGPVTFKARAGQTQGHLTALESVVAPGEGPPLHRHGREDEAYYVLDGAVRFLSDGRTFDAPRGSFVFVPQGAEHCFRNDADDAARLLVLFTPSGMERFFEGVARLPAGRPSPQVFTEVGLEAFMEVTGPPLGPRT
ncbi:cupin domain-containing protein [Kineococcus rubinsiae]|uniref:cupin domain-containing protein n=1 Tax=Kineococcus rubinsiae TaxID=2609562 RepID=UPI00143087FB|nr:cupin domain-containing protein [Kineococcus rubinsiae]NIZ92621.1 cupin domain-containing protein [Kineococcus rubinsiae]